VVDTDKCHILMGRLRQHDVNAIYRGRESIYMFIWKGKIVAMRSIPFTSEFTKENKPKFISICNRDEFLVGSKEINRRFALVIKKKVTLPVEMPKKMRPLSKEFKGVVHDELLEGLPPMRGIPHHNDLIPKVSLLNLSHYRMHLKESEVLKEKIEELIPKSHNRKNMNLVIGLPRIQKIADFLRKSNKKYRTTSNKKRRETL